MNNLIWLAVGIALEVAAFTPFASSHEPLGFIMAGIASGLIGWNGMAILHTLLTL